MKVSRLCERVIVFGFSSLFFFIPLLLTPLNYELFEYNKMMAVYALTTLIVVAWLGKMVSQKKIIFQRTPFDLPIGLFFATQLLSTFVSLDRHVSLWGYYSRFHGGLISTISYLLLYYALVSNLDRERVIKLFKISLLSGLLVSFYGFLEHFGIDKDLWVQDVMNRVFSTLGQPNWLAAYLVILLPLTWVFIFISNGKSWVMDRRTIFYYLVSIIYYLTLLFTKSRSGLIAFGLTYLLFWSGLFVANKQNLKVILRPFLFLTLSYFFLLLIVGTPWTPKIQEFIVKPAQTAVLKPLGTAMETGGTESGEIRKIVWKGAWDIARHYPLFGSGVETFAYAYYQYRPQEHNLVSEWDFLYNKAHNEYLNYAATTGFAGLGAYLLMIIWFIIWIGAGIWRYGDIRKDSPSPYLLISLLAGYSSILITNFFGFSVVTVALYFYLIPGMSWLIFTKQETEKAIPQNPLSPKQKVFLLLLLFFLFSCLFSLGRRWYADTVFNKGYLLTKSDSYKDAYFAYHKAINLNPNEPFYRDELAYTAALLASAAWEQKEATVSSQLADEAIAQNKLALKISPFNVNFWKTQTKVYYTLAAIDPKYNEDALTAIMKAQKLAPTDAKISYNLALLYGRNNNPKMAIKTLEDTVSLKPNYQDARFALALYYKEAGRQDEAIIQLRYILEKISSDAASVKDKLKEWGQ